MKFMKLTMQIEAELAIPIGDPTPEQIADAMSEETKAAAIAEIKADTARNYAASNGKLTRFEAQVEIVEV